MKTSHVTFHAAAALRIQHRSTHAASRPAHWTTPAPDWSAQPKLLRAFPVLGILHPSGHPAPSWLLDAPGPSESSWPPVPSWTLGGPWPPVVLPAVQQPPFRSASSKPLGSVLNTQHPPGSPSNVLATRHPPGYPALSWLFGHLLIARCTDRSMSSWLLSDSVPLAAQRTPGHSMHSRPFGAPGCLAHA